MSLSRSSRLLAYCASYLIALILVLGSRALAADSFSGDHFGVCVGVTNNTGPVQHYSYWAYYTVYLTGTLTGLGEFSKQDGAAPPAALVISDNFRVYLRERVLMGLNKLAKNRIHARLNDNLELGVYVPLHDDDDWHLIVTAPPHAGIFGDNRDLNDDYWYVQYQIDDTAGGDEYHTSVVGVETYDGNGIVAYEKNYSQGDGLAGGTGSTSYSVSGNGELQRYTTLEKGWLMYHGAFLATSRVAHDDAWGISLSVLKPGFGSSSLASLQGPYWLARIQYNNVGGADEHSVSLGKVYFDGAGGADLWITRNVKGAGLTSEFEHQTYAVGLDGSFVMGDFSGGVGGGPWAGNRVVLAAEVSTASKQGIMVLLKQSGIEDPSPLCHVLGLTP
jgi:hypothetical protein